MSLRSWVWMVSAHVEDCQSPSKQFWTLFWTFSFLPVALCVLHFALSCSLNGEIAEGQEWGLERESQMWNKTATVSDGTDKQFFLMYRIIWMSWIWVQRKDSPRRVICQIFQFPRSSHLQDRAVLLLSQIYILMFLGNSLLNVNKSSEEWRNKEGLLEQGTTKWWREGVRHKFKYMRGWESDDTRKGRSSGSRCD